MFSSNHKYVYSLLFRHTSTFLTASTPEALPFFNFLTAHSTRPSVTTDFSFSISYIYLNIALRQTFKIFFPAFTYTIFIIYHFSAFIRYIRLPHYPFLVALFTRFQNWCYYLQNNSSYFQPRVHTFFL